MKEILVPVSIGELVDKITILKIKLERIDDAAKLANVRKEHDALVNVCQQAGIDLSLQSIAELKQINEALWDIEDEIRDKERSKQFDARFIELARAVYVTNDKRMAKKGEVNKALGSAFFEEKSYKPY